MLWINLFPQATERVAQYMDSLDPGKDHEAIAHEYKRLAWLSDKTSEEAEAWFTAGMLYKEHGNFESAAANFAVAASFLSYDSLYFEALYQNGMMLFTSNDYSGALAPFSYAWSGTKDEAIRAKNGFMILLCLNNLFKWEKARQFAQKYYSDTAIYSSVISAYDSVLSVKLKSTKKARTLSMILPGAGQVYAGKLGKGMLSAFLNIVPGGLAVIGIIDKRYFLTFGTLIPFFGRFYIGGTKYAEALVKQWNYNKNLELALSMNKLLISARR